MNDPKVVITLAHLMDADGSLGDQTIGRVRLGCLLAASADAILFIGWPYRTDTSLSIGQAMANYAVSKGLCDPEKILVNSASRDTVGDAILSRAQLENRFPEGQITVTTSDYHVARTSEIFTSVWGNHRPLAVAGAPTAPDPLRDLAEVRSLKAFRQTFDGVPKGDLDAFLERLKSAHPFYNGTAMPNRPFEQT